MPLETLEQGPRIQELTIRTPEKPKEYLFDPYKDISEKRWERLLLRLEDLRFTAEEGAGKWSDWALFAHYLKILRPDFVGDLKLDKKAKKQMVNLAIAFRKDTLALRSGETPTINQLLNMSAARELFPASQSIRENMTEAVWNRYYNFALTCRPGVLLHILVLLKLASPENASKLEIPPSAVQSIVDGLGKFENLMEPDIAKFRILFPDIDVKQYLNTQQLNDYKRNALKEKGQIVWGYHRLAIISADKVIVDDTGLHLEFNHERKAPTEDATPVPEKIKF